MGKACVLLRYFFLHFTNLLVQIGFLFPQQFELLFELAELRKIRWVILALCWSGCLVNLGYAFLQVILLCFRAILLWLRCFPQLFQFTRIKWRFTFEGPKILRRFGFNYGKPPSAPEVFSALPAFRLSSFSSLVLPCTSQASYCTWTSWARPMSCAQHCSALIGDYFWLICLLWCLNWL